MKLRSVAIKNFKAIEDATLEVADFTVIVGANGSGKSSVLQALHWMFQSGRSRKIEPRADPTKARVLSERDANYMPTPQYRSAGHSAEYGNKQGAPQFELKIQAVDANGNGVESSMWIRSAHNEGISVHLPSGNAITSTIRDRREISAYIPGLAGIPLEEERRGQFIVNRQAAAGDANTVLRNILLRLSEGDTNSFQRLQQLVSDVMGPLTLRVTFDDASSGSILAEFQTEQMGHADPKRFRPLELAGIGFLQVIQIFAYLVHYRPVVLLVDEPDAHLHPSTQERLIRSLAAAAREFDTQVLLTTHSPSVVRALPAEARVIWMRDGHVVPDGDTSGRQLMGWGLLDRRILLLTEDSKTHLLRAILAQWPDLERAVALWPLHGSGKLLDPEGCASLQALFGESMRIVVHRDRDFMMPAEADVFAKAYTEKSITAWLTQHSDLESYWCSAEVIDRHFDFGLETAQAWLDMAVEQSKANGADQQCRNSKRHDLRNKPPLKSGAEKGTLSVYGDDAVCTEYSKLGLQHIVLGKTLVARIRAVAAAAGGLNAAGFGKSVPGGLASPIASDLEQLLRNCLK